MYWIVGACGDVVVVVVVVVVEIVIVVVVDQMRMLRMFRQAPAPTNDGVAIVVDCHHHLSYCYCWFVEGGCGD